VEDCQAARLFLLKAAHLAQACRHALHRGGRLRLRLLLHLLLRLLHLALVDYCQALVLVGMTSPYPPAQTLLEIDSRFYSVFGYVAT
jgi:hypothetical protein